MEDKAKYELSYPGMIPMEMQNELIQIAADTKRNSFRIGDITNDLLKFYTEKNHGEIYEAVASIVMKETRTIREYAYIAGIFPVDTRDNYEPLSFDHFRKASRLEYSLDALDWCIEQMDTLGRPATVDAMVAWIAAQQNGEAFVPDWEIGHTADKLRQSLDRVRKLVTDNDLISDTARDRLIYAIQAVEVEMDYVEQMEVTNAEPITTP